MTEELHSNAIGLRRLKNSQTARLTTHKLSRARKDDLLAHALHLVRRFAFCILPFDFITRFDFLTDPSEGSGTFNGVQLPPRDRNKPTHVWGHHRAKPDFLNSAAAVSDMARAAILYGFSSFRPA